LLGKQKKKEPRIVISKSSYTDEEIEEEDSSDFADGDILP